MLIVLQFSVFVGIAHFPADSLNPSISQDDQESRKEEIKLFHNEMNLWKQKMQ